MKHNIILSALLVVIVSGGTNAQSYPVVKATTHQDSAGEYPSHGSGLIGLNQPLPGTPIPQVSPIGPEEVIDVGGSDAFCQKGKAEISKGNWHTALQDFQQALSLWVDSPEALYGKAQCIATLGDPATALKIYRALIYTNDPSRYGLTPGDGFQENLVIHLMPFALLLNKTGQTAEALSIYNRAAYLLDYQDSRFNGGKPHLKVLLPELVEERLFADQVHYTPERLQALAETAMAHEEIGSGGDKEGMAHIKESVTLYPDGVTYYYLGEALMMQGGTGAKAAYQKAVQIGDDQTVAAAKEKIAMCR